MGSRVVQADRPCLGRPRPAPGLRGFGSGGQSVVPRLSSLTGRPALAALWLSMWHEHEACRGLLSPT